MTSIPISLLIVFICTSATSANTTPSLNAILIEFTNFTRTKPQLVTLEPLEVYPKEITIRRRIRYKIPVTLTGEDKVTLIISNVSWTRLLKTCYANNILSIRQNIWQFTPKNESALINKFIDAHCKTRGSPKQRGKQLRIEMPDFFVLKRQISVNSIGTTYVSAQRGYAHDSLTYKVCFNISGIWEDKNISTSAEDIENFLPQSGLTFVRKLDTLTVLAEAAAELDYKYPISTVYKTSP